MSSMRYLWKTGNGLIAAPAIKHNMKLATINRKHFDRVDDLELVDITAKSI